MKEKKNIILILVLVIGVCFVFYQTKKTDDTSYYRGLLEDFVDSFASREKASSFLKKNLDTTGAVLWQEVDQDVSQFLTNYAKVQNKEAIEDALFPSLGDSLGRETFKIKLVRVLDIHKNPDSPLITEASITVKVKEKDDSWQQVELNFTFYQGKFIDIETVESDGSVFSLMENLVEYFDIHTELKTEENHPFSSIQLEGYYVYKGEQTWHAFQFLENNKVRYLLHPCPGSACGGYIELGTYEIKGRELIVTTTEYMADVEEDTFDKPKKYRFKIISQEEMVLEKNHYYYQEDSIYE